MFRFVLHVMVFFFFALALAFHPLPSALAQGPSAGTQFKDADANKDGKVDAPELTIVILKVTTVKFKQLDKNGDGALDENEFKAAGTGKSFKDVDYNKDGKIDSSEFTVVMMTVSPEWFKQFDKDGSGALDEKEYNALMQKQLAF